MAAKSYFIYTFIILLSGPITIFGMRRGFQVAGKHGRTIIKGSGRQFFRKKSTSNLVSKRLFHKPSPAIRPSQINRHPILGKPQSIYRTPRGIPKKRLFWETGFGRRLAHTSRTIKKSRLTKWFGTTALGIFGASGLKQVTDDDRLTMSAQNPEQIITQMKKENAAESYMPFLINNAQELVKTKNGTRVLQTGLLLFADKMETKQIAEAVLPNLKQLNNAQTIKDAEQATFFFNQLLNKKPNLVKAISTQTINDLNKIITGESSMPLLHVLLEKDTTFAKQFIQVISDNPSHSFITTVHPLAQDALEDRFNILYKIGKDKPKYHKALLAAISQEKSGGQIQLFETKSGGLLLHNILESASDAPAWFTKSSAQDFDKNTIQKSVSNIFNSIAPILQTAHKDNLPLINKLLQTRGIINFKTLEGIGANLPNILYANPDAEKLLEHLIINNDTVRGRLLKQMQGETIGQKLLSKHTGTIPPTFKAFVQNIDHPQLSEYKANLLQAIENKTIAEPITLRGFKSVTKVKQPEAQPSLAKALERKPQRSWKSYLPNIKLPEIKIPGVHLPQWPRPRFLQ